MLRKMIESKKTNLVKRFGSSINSKNKIMLLFIGLVSISISSFVYAEITWSDGTPVGLTIADSHPWCVKGESWLTWGGGEDLIKIPSKNDCFRPDGLPSPKCCVYGEKRCNTNTLPATCSLPPIFYCEEYNETNYGGIEAAKGNCSQEDVGVGKATIEKESNFGEGFCSSGVFDIIEGVICVWYIHNCRCMWDETNNKCIANFTKTGPYCENSSEPVPDQGQCIVSVFEKKDECDTTGYITYSSKAEWVGVLPESGPVVCKDTLPVRFRCAIKLIFFTIASLIVTIAVIVIIYLILLKRKARKKVKRKAKKK